MGKLTEQLNKKAERTKPTIFFLPGFFIVLFIPVWSQFQIVLFKGISLNDAISLLVIHFIILALLTYLLAAFKHITDDLVTLRRQSILHLIDYIEDIILNKMDEKKHAEWYLDAKEAKKEGLINHTSVPSFTYKVSLTIEFGDLVFE